MPSILKCLLALALAGLLLTGGRIADLALNEGRLFYALIGRDALVAACRPELERVLAEKGFSPTDIEFGPRPDIAAAAGLGRRLAGGFTFTDGPAGERVDGVAACVVAGSLVRVEVRVRTTPRRAA